MAELEDTVAMTKQDASSGGTQAVSRAARILRMIARRGIEGTRLTQLTRYTGLPHPTVRRILKCLIIEGLVIQDAASKLYRLGPLNFELGLATLREVNSERAYQQILANLAQASGDTVYLMARSGADVVCLDRAEGSFPIRAHLFSIGGRRPLGFGAAGLALLSSLCDADIQRIIAINAHEIEVHPRLSIEYLMDAIERTRARGYAITSDIYTMGIGSVGVAIPNGDQDPVYALNLSTVGADRFTPGRIAELQRLMVAQIAQTRDIRPMLTDEMERDYS
ncbi:IclR family transcriptional regulator [Sphingosinicella soli]|uniref:DNA-binding IclR family transcriptional regulator n=1 Tax=Sphingosinicella soli TaxID=333708 RepID=A0A7W7F6U4_9SPHN|nr:IclR family transcriptional regulator [Sphingosinicella soli]MBB4632691.1 DNA-binding IclR family transcriptional regulator [Sphingosinicella soli]